ncbi:hypothetical protein VNO77_19432 [Canavalia gladiata]|uniref:Uncharacterized protein n=1 Tax=Canavalia gladiata TaxID=3824 RepID=A0AAN9LMF6_CANGL
MNRIFTEYISAWQEAYSQDLEFEKASLGIMSVQSIVVSKNSVERAAVSTIHVTPEDGFSYASFETLGYDLKAMNLNELVERVLACFQPTEFFVAVHVDKSFEQSTFLDFRRHCCKERNQHPAPELRHAR